jgi:hypothetical protein
MKHPKSKLTGALLGAAAGTLTLLFFAGAGPAAAQAPDAAERCTPDVMRLCSEFVPDADRIVQCLKVKRRQLSTSCRTALAPQSKSKLRKAKAQARRN